MRPPHVNNLPTPRQSAQTQAHAFSGREHGLNGSLQAMGRLCGLRAEQTKSWVEQRCAEGCARVCVRVGAHSRGEAASSGQPKKRPSCELKKLLQDAFVGAPAAAGWVVRLATVGWVVTGEEGLCEWAEGTGESAVS